MKRVLKNIPPFGKPSAHAAGGVWEPTAENFPDMVHFFPCTETPGAAVVLSDVINGVKFPAGDWSVASDGVGLELASPFANAPLLDGSWVSPGTTPFSFIIVADTDAAALVTMGRSAAGAQEVTARSSTIQPKITDGTVTDYGTLCVNPGSGIPHAFGSHVAFDGNITTFQTDVDGAYTENAAVAVVNLAGGMSNIQPYVQLSSSTLMNGLYGILVMHWANGLPALSLRKVGIEWMTHYWPRGYKFIYPGWKR